MTLAKFNRCPSTTTLASVSKPVNTSGASVISTSCRLRSTSTSSRVMTMKDSMPASVKAPTMVRPDSRIEMGAPVASGAISSTWSLKADKAAGSLVVSLGETWMRAVPSGAIQSDRISAGMVAAVTGAAFSESDTVCSMDFSPGTKASAARARAAGPAFTTAVKASASLRASCAGLSAA